MKVSTCLRLYTVVRISIEFDMGSAWYCHVHRRPSFPIPEKLYLEIPRWIIDPTTHIQKSMEDLDVRDQHRMTLFSSSLIGGHSMIKTSFERFRGPRNDASVPSLSHTKDRFLLDCLLFRAYQI